MQVVDLALPVEHTEAVHMEAVHMEVVTEPALQVALSELEGLAWAAEAA